MEQTSKFYVDLSKEKSEAELHEIIGIDFTSVIQIYDSDLFQNIQVFKRISR